MQKHNTHVIYFFKKITQHLLVGFMFGFLLMIEGCTSLNASSHFRTTPLDTKIIYIVNYSWHCGIIIQKKDIPQHLIPEKNDFPAATYIEVGWGSKEYYQSKKFKLDLALKVLVLPGHSALYLSGSNEKPTLEHSDKEIIQLALSSTDFYNLLKTIDQYFDRRGQKRISPVFTLSGQTSFGLSNNGSRFYNARGTYSLFNTCNMWVAKILHSGNLPVSTSFYSATSISVMSQVRPYRVWSGPCQ